MSNKKIHLLTIVMNGKISNTDQKHFVYQAVNGIVWHFNMGGPWDWLPLNLNPLEMFDIDW